jgi:hypothetical protein
MDPNQVQAAPYTKMSLMSLTAFSVTVRTDTASKIRVLGRLVST